MRKKLQRTLGVLLALMMMLSVPGISVSAAEWADENAQMIAESGAGTPVITSAESGEDGITLTWSAVDGVYYYRVYRWYDDGRGWVKLKDTDLLYYADTNVTSGRTYQYRLVGINAAGGVITSTATRSAIYYAPVHVTNAENAADGIRVYWNKEGVDRVAVYRMGESGWRRIAVSPDSSYLDTDVTYTGEYRYTVRALTDSGVFRDDFYDKTGVTIRRLTTPVLRAESAVGGVSISWDAVEGAEGYRVFYRNSKGGWSRLGDTTSPSLLDTDVLSGKSYTYTVRCISADGAYYTSYFDTAGKTVAYVAAPELLSADGTVDGIKISWKASGGAAKYRVFYRNSSGDWTRLGDTASTSYLDKNVVSGKSYTYTVRCLNAAGDYISSFDHAGVSGVYLSAPVFTVSNGADGVDIRWGAVDGAEKYRVYYYGSKGWTRLADTTETSLTDTDVSSNHTYTYTVRCVNAAGTEFTSGYLAGKGVKYIAAPTVTTTGTPDGVRITWNAVAGAEKYRVYYYGSKGWTKMADTAATSYLDTDIVSGKTYTYTVRCINSAGNAFMSYFKPGVSRAFVSAPDFSLTRNDSSITVGWDAVDGAELYRVYTYTASGWTKLADTADTSFEHTGIVSGGTYTYTVRCLNADATAFTSDYRAGKSMKFVETPRISGVSNAPDGVSVTWEAVGGAVKYRVYYKSGSGWTRIADTTDTAYMHTAAVSGTTYTYTVRCVNAAGNAFESSYDPEGASVHYIAAPRSLKAESYRNSVKISWKLSEGAEKYRVYYKGRNGWTRLAETTSDFVIDTDVSSGTTYTYTVRCINADGTSFTSDFNHDGVACKYTDMPVLKSLEVTKDGVQIAWSASKNAEKYRVYSYGSKGWTRIAETTSTAYLDTTAVSGSTCRYTVRCITADGKSFTSDCDTTGLSAYYVSAPQLLSAQAAAGSATITWTKPAGASKYRVYKKISGSWQRLTDTSANSYTDTDVSVGSTYTYTVRVINDAGNLFYSGYDPNGFVVTVAARTDSFCYYDQGDYSYPYGDDTIAYSGCGPTCFAMVASTITGRTITPVDAVKWCGNKYYVDNVGTRWDYFAAASNQFGIKLVTDYDSSRFDSVITALKQGKYVISSQSAGIFTRSGHFIVLAGITASGQIIVYDPNGGNHYVGTAFTRGDITASGTHYWVFDKK